jgi:hypothetical protein
MLSREGNEKNRVSLVSKIVADSFNSHHVTTPTTAQLTANRRLV